MDSRGLSQSFVAVIVGYLDADNFRTTKILEILGDFSPSDGQWPPSGVREQLCIVNITGVETLW